MSKRREFLKHLSIGSLGAVCTFQNVNAKSKNHNPVVPEIETVKLGQDVVIDFLSQGELFQGIGNVFIQDTKMRSAERPMFVEIISPDGIKLIDYRIIEKKITENEIRLKFKAKAQQTDLMEWMLHTVRNRRNLSDWSLAAQEAEGTELELIILPVSRKLGKYTMAGFSYQYRYKSSNIPIYKILDRGSWEINGNAIGNQFWMRNGSVDSITKFSTLEQFYSTEWYLPGIANPNIFQFHPLQTHLQGFTFTTSDKGVIVTWPNKVSHVRSLFEKWRNNNEIIHFHEHCNDLSLEFETSPVEVLWCSDVNNDVQRANVYESTRDFIHEELHQQINMRRERVSTYGIIEEWTEPDFDRYREKGLSKLLAAGAKTVFIPNQCQNAMNTWGLSNMCCNVDFKIAETVGEDKLKKFCDTAKAAGTRIEMWGNTALSTTVDLFSHRDGEKKGIAFLPYEGSIMEVIDKAESPWIRNPSNAIEADHYTPRFCALNLRDKNIRAYWMKQWKYFHDNLGIQGIFLDSSFNMSSDKFHFRQWPENNNWHGATLDQKDVLGKHRPEHEPPKLIHTMYHAHLDWVVEMQKMGYHYCGEDLGVFGINRTGPDAVKRAANLFLWQDSYCDFDEAALTKAGYKPYDIFFKGLAYRTMWKLWWDIKEDKIRLGTDDPRAYTLLKVFNEVADNMFNREILADEKAVVYSKDGKVVVWCFEDIEYPLKNKRKILNMVTKKSTVASILKGNKHQVYFIQ